MSQSKIFMAFIFAGTFFIATSYNACSDVRFADDIENLANIASVSSVVINNNEAFTKNQLVNLSLSGFPDGEMLISNSSDCSSGTWEPYSFEKPWSLAEQNQDVKVYAKFRHGTGVESPCVSDNIVHDNIPPDLNVTNPANFFTKSSSVNIGFNVTDATSGVENSFCSDDSNNVTNVCSNPAPANNLPEGEHFRYFRAVDKAGNISDIVDYSWTVDQTPPTITINSGPPAITGANSASFTFTGSDNFASPQEITYECQLDNGGWNSCQSPKNYTNISAGSHKFYVRATDKAGNTSEPATHDWQYYDGQATVTILTFPDPISKVTDATFTFVGVDNGQPTNVFQCRLDGGVYESCSSPKSYTNLPQGTRLFEVRTQNLLGEFTQPAAYTWLVDSQVSNITVSGPSSPSNSSSAVLQINTPDNDIAKYECRLNAAPFADCQASNTYNDLASGSYTFQARVVDVAGNVSNTASHQWVVDVDKPTVAFVAATLPAPVVTSTSASIEFTASDNLSSGAQLITECKFDNEPVFSVCTSPKTLSLLADGTHTLTVQARDEAGNISNPIVHTWVIDTSIPVINFVKFPGQDDNVFETQETIVNFSVSLTPGRSLASLNCFLNNEPQATCTANVDMTLPGQEVGEYTYRVEATDDLNNQVSKSVVWDVLPIGKCDELDVPTCIVLKDDFERVDILDPNSQIGWSKILDDVLQPDRVDICIFPHEFCNYVGNPIGNGSLITPAGEAQKSAYFIGRPGGSIHSMYLVSKTFDLSDFDNIEINLKYLLVSLETFDFNGFTGDEHFMLQICNAGADACGLGADQSGLNNENVWTTVYELSGSDANPINPNYNGTNHLVSDWQDLAYTGVLADLTTNKSEFAFRINVKIDEGFYPNGTFDDAVGIDDVIVKANKSE